MSAVPLFCEVVVAMGCLPVIAGGSAGTERNATPLDKGLNVLYTTF